MNTALGVLEVVLVVAEACTLAWLTWYAIAHRHLLHLAGRRCSNCAEKVTWEAGRADHAADRLRDHEKVCLS
ncbi:hypothetical protein [Agromyces humi]|uniref:hypothetical protein n=1 Tax=Agromyces humi TaxID=1766800 RepID=UPI0013585EA6|nr:hypothetical protein [Agromyces humi]